MTRCFGADTATGSPSLRISSGPSTRKPRVTGTVSPNTVASEEVVAIATAYSDARAGTASALRELG